MECTNLATTHSLECMEQRDVFSAQKKKKIHAFELECGSLGIPYLLECKECVLISIDHFVKCLYSLISAIALPAS